MVLSPTSSKDVDHYISTKEKNRCIQVKVEEVEADEAKADEVLADPNLVTYLILPGRFSLQY